MTSEIPTLFQRLLPGDQAPQFCLPNQWNLAVTLETFLTDNKGVVVYFYPKDDTPGCTAEACDFATSFADIQALNYNVVGISPDGTKSHESFRLKYQLPFQLLSDFDSKVAKTWGAFGDKKLYGKTFTSLLRSTFIVETSGKIEHAFYNVKATGHLGRILKTLNAKTP